MSLFAQAEALRNKEAQDKMAQDNVQRTKLAVGAAADPRALRTIGEFRYGGARTEVLGSGKRYIPLSALEALGRVFLEGIPKYGEHNWKQGAGDKKYQMERWEHASRHLQLWVEGDRSEDHLAKVMWFCATQIELERMEKEKAVDLDRLFDEVNRLQAKDEEYGTASETPVRESYTTISGSDSEGVVDTLKDVGLEVGTEVLIATVRKLFEQWRQKQKNGAATPPDGVVEVKKEKEQPRTNRVMSEEGKARTAAAQRKRWAKVRREKKAQERKG